MRKYLLSICLVALLFITLPPMQANAAELVASGECGDGLTWTLDSDGVLIVSGEGAMPDWLFPEIDPWMNQRNSIKTAIIQPGVTHIGGLSFYSCANLTSISIPNSVTSIGEDAFSGTGYVNSYGNWENDVLYIDKYLIMARTRLSGAYIVKDGTVLLANGAFSDCSMLTGITLPDSVKHIGDEVFSGCKNLADITLPSEITDIGEKVFTDTKYYSTETNWEDGVLYLGNCLLKASTELSGVYSIKDGTKSIQYQAFYGCDKLTSVDIPNSVVYIGASAFLKCSSLSNITIPEQVTSIGEWAFSSCTGLKSVFIPPSVESIGYSAFAYCNQIEKIELSEGLKRIGPSAFSNGAYYVEDLTIPSTVESIGHDAFSPRWSLKSIEVMSGNMRYHSAGNCLIETKTGTLLYGSNSSVIPNDGSVTSIGDEAFLSCIKLRSIEIPVSVTSIGDFAFWNCSKLRSIEIPTSVTSIGYRAFEECYKLYDLSLPDNLTNIGHKAFDGSGYFSNEENWENDVLYYGKYLLSARSTLSGAYAVKDGTTVITGDAFADCVGLTDIKLPNSVISIGDGAFSGCTGLTEIWLPPQISVIEPSTFSSCTSLKNVHIPEGVKQIGYRAFEKCTALTDIFIPGSVEIIEEDAFWLSPNLENVKLSDGIISIGDAAFWKCGIKQIVLPNSLTSIGDRVFCNCTSLESVVIPQSVKYIHSLAFLNCSALTDIIYIGTPEQKAEMSIDDEAEIDEDHGVKLNDILWNYVSSKTYYTVSVQENAHGTVLTNQRYFGAGDTCKITVLPNLGYHLKTCFMNGKKIDGSTFSVTEDTIVSVEIELLRPGVEIIDSGVCFGNQSVTWYLYADGELVIDGLGEMLSWHYQWPWNAQRENIKKVVIKTGVTSIGDMAFANCSSLTSVEIPASVTSIGDYAFSNCSSLMSIKIPVSATSIGSNAFSRCSSLTSITIPASVTSIGEDAFAYCRRLTFYGYPGSVAEDYAESKDIPFKSLDDPAVLKALLDPENEAAAVVAFASDGVRTIPVGGQALVAVYDEDGRFVDMAQAVVWNYSCYTLLDETQLGAAVVTFFILDDSYAPVYVQLSAAPAF